MNTQSFQREHIKIVSTKEYLLPKSYYKKSNDGIEKVTSNRRMNRATQTNHNFETSDPNINLKRKYKELKAEYRKIYSLVVDLKKSMESLSKEANFKGGGKRNLARDDNDKENVDKFSKMIQIGSKGTEIPKLVYDSINWSTYTTATRKLLITLFSRKVLATHSLTGKPSRAFLTSNKETKGRLNPNIIADIIQVVSRKSQVTESLVRSAITTKCADENKLYKKRLQRGSDEEEENRSIKKRRIV